MHYTKFVIKNYKAIEGEMEINIKKNSILPIIGINESGKTSILWALFSFDYTNDGLNGGRHLENIENLYKTITEKRPSISADIMLADGDLQEVLGDVLEDKNTNEEILKETKKMKRRIKEYLCTNMIIERDLNSRDYLILNSNYNKISIETNKVIAKKVVQHCPYMIYFDDFRDPVPEEIEIGDNPKTRFWINIIEQLFKRTQTNLSVHKLKGESELRRESILGDVRKRLNESLTKEWQKFSVEEGNTLHVDLQYLERNSIPFIKLRVKEKIGEKDRYFGINDRSKGFFWFFNFVMKLEFNPKIRHFNDKDTIYLLDEPGSYLHASAQQKLCEKLHKLSENGTVIYCTHSHYLLDPDKIPINSVRIARKDKEGNVILLNLQEYSKENDTDSKMALQPIMEALQVKPFITNLDDKHLCIVEGIYDYYCYSMLCSDKIRFLPALGADTINYYISIAISWRLKYSALWDDDENGKKAQKKAYLYFGEEEEKRLFLLKHSSKRKKKTILQDLFENNDLKTVKEKLEINRNVSFEKTILSLFYHTKKDEIIKGLSQKTLDNFKYLEKLLLQIS